MLFGWQERLVAGYCLPASIAVNEDVGEADASYWFAGWIKNLVQSADEGGIAVDVCMHIFQTILPRPALGNVRQRGGAVVEFALDASVLKFIGEEAGDGSGIVLFERVCPGTFEVEQCGFRLWLGWAGGRGRRHAKSKDQDEPFRHVFLLVRRGCLFASL